MGLIYRAISEADVHESNKMGQAACVRVEQHKIHQLDAPEVSLRTKWQGFRVQERGTGETYISRR